MRLSDISDTKTLRAGFPDICRAIKEKETDMEVTEKNRTKYRMPGEFEPHEYGFMSGGVYDRPLCS